MSPGYIPPINISTDNPFSAGLGKVSGMDGMSGMAQKFQMEPVGDTQKASFKEVLGNTLQNVNETLGAPDTLMHQAITTGNVDIHDVMIANAKAELTINVTSQIATKVMQAYDRILQIQI